MLFRSAARGQHHSGVWSILGIEQPRSTWSEDDFYADALPCLKRLRSRGLLVGAVGNTPAEAEDLLGAHVDLVGSSVRWGVEKPAPGFFARLTDETGVSPGDTAYVGDRVDNDVRPALTAGMLAVHIRRGPWGHLHEAPPEALRIGSLDELPEAVGV